jgi:hypothetical protein
MGIGDGKMTEQKLRKMTSDTHYELTVVCINCDYGMPEGIKIAIKKGSTINQRACPNCGCTMLKAKRRKAYL